VLVLGTDVSGLYDPGATPPAADFTAFDETSVPHSGILPRSGQSAVTLPGDKQILISGGVDGNNHLLGQALFNPAKIWTDKDDYQPDEPVILSGSGWKANEGVHLYAVDNETEQWTYEMTTPADADGEFVVSPLFIVQLRHLGVQFHVTALGAQSTMQSDVYFTDSQPGSVSLSPTSASVSPGSTAHYTATVTKNGNNTSCTLTFSLTYTGTPPVGTTPTFAPNPVTMANADVTSALSIATTNTGPMGGRTQPGTYNFTVTVTKGADCQGGAGTVTTPGTLMVTGPSPTPTATATATATFTPTPTPTPTPTATAAATNLTVTAATGTYGGTSTAFTATLKRTSDNSPVAGKTITFTLNGNPAGTGVTNASGVATSGTVSLCGSSYNVSGSPYLTGAAASFAGDLSFSGASGSNSLTVGKANATVVVTPYDVPYNGSSHTATVTSITGVCGETGGTVGTVDVSGTTHVSAAGSPYTDTWTFTGTGNYNNIAAGPSTTITDKINKINATWTTNPVSKTYGDADPAPLTTGSGSSFTAADAALLTVTYSRVAGENASPPTYHITATLGPADVIANYNITNNGAEFTINKRVASWTTNPASKTYGDADPSPLTTGNGSNFTDPVTATYSRVAGENASPPTYHINATLNAAAGVLNNYIITNDGAEFTINKRNATWTTNPATKTYGDVDPTPVTTGSGSNFVAADGVTATYNRVAGENASPPTYHITATLSATVVGALNNYNITNAGAEFTISKRDATWTTNPGSKTYGDTDPSPLTTGSGSGFIAGDGVTASYSRVAGENASPPTYHITATLNATVAGALANYNITNRGAEFTINKRDATWTTNPASKTYGNADPAPLTAGSGINFVAADGVTATYSRVAGENASPPTYHITATLSATVPGALANYNITNAGAEFTIDKRDATWTTNPVSKTYGDADPSPLTTGSGNNFVAADGVTATYSRVAGENASPPTYHITATLSATVPGALANYNITNAGAEFTIDKRDATWTTNPASKTYGDADPAPLTTGSGSNFVAADGVTATYGRVAGENASPPTYHITATLSATVAGALANYNVTNVGAEFTILKRVVIWTTNPGSKTYGDADPAPLTTGNGTNFVAADNVTATYARMAGENASPPTYHITATLHATPASALDNYIITNAGAEFTINKRLATWTTDPNNKTYGDADPSPLTTGIGSNFIAADNVTATYGRVAGENASPPSYHINATLHATPASALDNYIIANDGAEFTINKRAATWTTNPASKTYGDLDPSPLTTGSGSNFVPADGVTASYSRVTGENASPPTYHISATLSATVVGALDNYIITNVGAEFTINKRVATWTTDPNSKTYGDGDPAPLTTGTGTNFVAADNLTVTYSRAAGENASPPTYHITATLSATPISALDNYIVVNDGAEFTINKRSATWTTNPNSKTYGSPDPVPLTTGSGSNFVPADSVTASYNRAGGETVLGGPYHITATLSATPMSDLDNYNITNAGAAFAIKPKDLDVTANNRTKTYGDTVTFAGAEFAVGVGQLVTGDTVTTVTLTSAGAAATATFMSPGPDYPLVSSAAVGTGLDNYNIHYHNGTFHVNQAALTITATNVSKTYGNVYTPDTTTPSSDFSVSGLVNSDTVASVALSSTGYPATATYTSPGPDYTVTPSAAAGTGLGNYTIGYANGNLHVNQATVTITATNRTKTYGVTYTADTTPPSVDFNISGLVNTDSVTSITLSSGGYAASATFTAPGPDYTVTPSGAVGTGLGNYTIGYANGNLHVNQATLTITATNRSKAFAATYTPDTTPPSVDFSVSGLVSPDTVTSITLACPGYAAAALPQANPYVVTPSAAVGTGLGNYIIGYMTGQFTIGYGTCTGSNGPGGVILQPINADGTSVFPKAGRTVPVKFTVCDANGNPISDPTAVFAGTGGALTMLGAVRGQLPQPDESQYNDIPDAAFRYSSGIWIFNMSTSNLQSGYSYTFRINLANGYGITFVIAIK
jgi:hypothetical protein